jgi:hypothetical protein
MARVIPVLLTKGVVQRFRSASNKTRAPRTRRRLVVELAPAKAVWPDIKSTFELKYALWVFAVYLVGVAVLGAFNFPPGRTGVSEHQQPGYVVRQQDVVSP